MRGRVVVTACASLALALGAAACGDASRASAAGPWWHLDSGSRPASIPAGGAGELALTAENVGDAQA